MSNQKKTESDNETIVRQDAPGEDWLNGRQGACGACGKEESLYFNGESGLVQCHACGYTNPDATRETVLYLMEQRKAGAEELAHLTKRFGDLTKAIGFPEDAKNTGIEAVVEFARVNREALKTADRVNQGYSEKVKKLEADLKEARAKSKAVKVEDHPQGVKTEEETEEKATPEAKKE